MHTRITLLIKSILVVILIVILVIYSQVLWQRFWQTQEPNNIDTVAIPEEDTSSEPDLTDEERQKILESLNQNAAPELSETAKEDILKNLDTASVAPDISEEEKNNILKSLQL